MSDFSMKDFFKVAANTLCWLNTGAQVAAVPAVLVGAVNGGLMNSPGAAILTTGGIAVAGTLGFGYMGARIGLQAVRGTKKNAPAQTPAPQ